MTTINLNQSPYFDDFLEGKKFYQILFRPGRAVQARELNQLQTLLKNQVDRLGKYIFQNGSIVLPGEGEGVKYTPNVPFIKLPASAEYKTESAANLETYWKDKILVSVSLPTGVRAKVIGYREADQDNNHVRLFLSYLNSNSDGTSTTFVAGQSISTEEAAPISVSILSGDYSTGVVSSVSVQEAIYFYNGRFVLVDAQTIFLTPPLADIGNQAAWNDKPTASVGLRFIESIVSWIDDDDLLDNASGSPNVGAPGADRLHISADLIQLDQNQNSTVQDYVELVNVVLGEVFRRQPTSRLSEVRDYVAKRTFDESGDYSVIPFGLQIKEFLRYGNNNGNYPETLLVYPTELEAKQKSKELFGFDGDGVAFLVQNQTGISGATLNGYVPATTYNGTNDPTSFVRLCQDRLSALIDPGKAYVKGYDIEKSSSTVVNFKKSRTTKYRNNRFVPTPLGTYVFVNNVYGALETNAYDPIDLYDTPIATRGSVSGTKIGTARTLAIEHFSGFYDTRTQTTDPRVYRLFLFDIRMNDGKKFEQVKSIYSTSPTFTCDCVLERYKLLGSVSKATRKITKSATTTAGSAVITITGAGATTSDLRVGMFVTGSASIPAGAYIINIASATTVTMSATATGASGTLTFVSVLDPSVGSNEQTIVGVGTLWRNDQSQVLSKDDYIEIDSGNSTSKIYKVAANPTKDTVLSLTSNISADTWLDGSSISYLYTPLRTDATTSGLLYPLPESPVATVRGGTSNGEVDPGAIDNVYTIRGTDTQNPVTDPILGTRRRISFTASEGTEFEDFNSSAYSVIVESGGLNGTTGTWLQVLPYGGDAALPDARTVFVRPIGNQLQVYFNQIDVNASTVIRVEYPLVKLGGSVSKERPKTLQKGSFSIPTLPGDTTGGFYQGGGYALSVGSDVTKISLGVPDVLKITRVVESPNYSTEPSAAKNLPNGHKDITGLYILDDGQRDYFYDIASVYLRPSAQRPRGRVRVEFDYFTHTGTGDYFSVNSYPFVGGTSLTQTMDYGEIPSYTSSDGTTYDLASCVDFRPVVGTSGIQGGFNTGGATKLGVPKENFRCDYHFYEARKDKLILDRSGEFYIKSGTPDVEPLFPDDPDTGMVIYELSVGPYTYSYENVFAQMRDNTRYTMRDIGKLEKRIKNLEYYTSLSLLEKDTSSLEIKDALGNNRFKNGFLVDNFKNHSSSDLGTLDYRCSIDPTTGTLRPIIREDAITSFEKVLMFPSAEQSGQRVGRGYQKTGDYLTLPYTKVALIQQLKASRTINVNPYAVFSYVGAVSITPWSDEWRETREAQAISVKDAAAWESARSQYGSSGTKIDYQFTMNNWIGTKITTEDVQNSGVVLQAGHDIMEKIGLTAKQQKNKRKNDDWVQVPTGYGYANEGEYVPVGKRNVVAKQVRTTTTLVGQEITTQMQSTFVDSGWSTPVSLGKRIIDTAMIEYMRTKEITFTGKAFMPFVQVYPFFDGVDVSAHCKPINGALGDPLKCDSRGRIEGIFIIPNSNALKFKTGDRIFRLTTSSINIQSPPPDSAGEARYTARGWIDTTQETTYSTRLYKIVTNTVQSTKDISEVISSTLSAKDACPQDPIAQSFYVYDQGGCFITDIDVFFATKPPELINGVANPDQPPIELQVRELGPEGNPSNKILPFGEVILEAGQVVINEIDTNTGTLKVTGYKGSDPKISPTKQQLGPWTNGEYNVNGQVKNYNPNDPSTVFSYGADPQPHMVPTRFTFESPVYLRQGGRYAFVLIANSIQYNVWIAQSGPDTTIADVTQQTTNNEIGTSRPILEDPYYQGALFKSSNGITWNADQSMDVKFKIWKANFNTAAKGEIEFVNQELPIRPLTLDAFEFASYTNLVRVTHTNHGHTTARGAGASGSASKVVFSPNYNVTLNNVTSTDNGDGTGTLTSTSSSGFDSIDAESFIKNPITGEQRRVLSVNKPAKTAIIERKFTIGNMTNVSGVPATSFVVPSGSSLGGISADFLFDFRGFDVKHTELDAYQIDLSSVLTEKTLLTKSATASGSTLTIAAGGNTSGLIVGMKVTQVNAINPAIGGDVRITSINAGANTVALSRAVNVNQATAVTFTFTDQPKLTGRFGGPNVSATENKRFEELVLITTPLTLSETDIIWNLQTTSGCGVNDSATSTFAVQPRQNFLPNDRVIFNNPMLVGSYINELPPAGSSLNVGGPSTVQSNAIGDRKSLQIRAVLKSTNPNLSPVIDVSRLTTYLVSHRLDTPRGVLTDTTDAASVINGPFDEYVCLPTTDISGADSGDIDGQIYFSTSSGTATGTVEGVSKSRILRGTNTKFLSEIRSGDVVKTLQNEERVVESVNSDTELLLDLPISVGFNGTLYITPPYLRIKTANAAIAKRLSTLDVGKYLTVTGAAETTVAPIQSRNFTDAKILSIDYTPQNTIADPDLSNSARLIEIVVDYKTTHPAGIELDADLNLKFVQKDRFIDEIAPEGGSCGSKYVTKKLVVSRASNALKFTFDAARHESCELELYYRLELANSNQDWDQVTWQKAEFNTELNGTLVAATPPASDSPNEFFEYEATVNGLPAFIGAQAKLIMRGGNPAKSPRIKNFRMIVLDD